VGGGMGHYGGTSMRNLLRVGCMGGPKVPDGNWEMSGSYKKEC